MTGLLSTLPRRAHDALVRSPALTLGLCVVAVALVALVSCTTTRSHTGPAGLRDRVEPLVRVRVRRQAGDVKVEGGARILVRDTATHASDLLVAPLRVGVVAGRVRLTDARGDHHEYPAFAEIELAPDRGAAPVLLTLDGVDMPGFLVIHPDPDDSATFDVVAAMPIEGYIPGVIAHELYGSWPAETFKAQAVCARSYALHERSLARAAGRHYDLESTTRDQVFGGATQNPTAVRAAEDTRGVVLTHHGRILRAYYASTCGGRAASAADTWPTTRGYEYNLDAPIQASDRPSACEASPLYRWTVTRDAAELSARIRAWGVANGHEIGQIGQIRSVLVGDRNSVGRPSSYRVSDDAARTFRISGEDLRVACNSPARGLDPITRETRINSGDFEVTIVRPTVTFRGRGFGHGVGMCQFSAKAFADKGWSWREIVRNFYPGANLTRVYD